jgi:hypothetical protein
MVETDGQIERLDADYRGAFDEWAVQVSRLQAIDESGPDGLVMPDGSVIKEAADRVAAAEADYRAMRNRLADNMSIRTSTCG